MSLPAVGERLGPHRVARVDMAFIEEFMDLMGDVNPVHNDVELAARLGLRGPVAQGPASLGHIADMVRAWRPEAFLQRLEFRFEQVVTVGDEPIAEGVVDAVTPVAGGHRVTCAVSLRLPTGEDLLRGTAAVLVHDATREASA